MRILQLAQFLPPIPGGEERHVWSLARALAARSHEVTLLGFATSEYPAGTSIEDGVRVVRVRTTASRLPVLYSDPTRPHALPLPDPEVGRAIAEELTRGRIEVVHAHNWIVNSALGPAEKAGVPVVMTLHDYSHVCATKRLMEYDREQCPGPSRKRCLPCARAHYGTANGIVTLVANTWSARRRARLLTEAAAVSNAVARVVAVPAGQWPHGAHIDARVIPNFIPDEIVVSEIPPAAPDAPILFAGDLTPDKGVQVLLDAYRLLDSPPPLVLAGRDVSDGGWQFPPGARATGPLPHEQVIALFRSARVVAVPSVVADACPTVVLEAMAAGRPVVASATGGIVDLVVDGQTGLLVEPGDASALAGALERILKEPRTAQAFGAAGLERSHQFTISALAERIEAMYSDAIEAKATG